MSRFAIVAPLLVETRRRTDATNLRPLKVAGSQVPIGGWVWVLADNHFEGPEGRFRVGQQVRVKVDPSQRDLHARLLCGGRVIESVGPLVFPDFQAVGADYRPHKAKVEFGAAEYLPSEESVWPDFRREVERCISLDLPVKTAVIGDGPLHRVQIGNFRPFTCTSGVYPRSLKLIGKLTITRVIAVGGRLQVRYRVGDSV